MTARVAIPRPPRPSYREQPPPPALAAWLQCTWEREIAEGGPVRVLPDGCIDVVWIEGVGARIVGANTTASLVRLPAGTRVAGARLRPGAAPALLGVRAEHLRDAWVPVHEAWAGEGARLGEALAREGDTSITGHRAPPRDRARIAGAREGGPVDVLRAALMQRRARAQAPDPLVREAVARLARPGATVADLGGDLGVSERQLRRRVTAAVGYGPKRLARVLRLRIALQAARDGETLAVAAFGAGYADQAHFAHDCRELAGLPPSRLLVS